MRRLDDQIFAAVVLVLSLLFGWVLWPFFGAILWAVVTAIVFAPVHSRVRKALPRRPGTAALLTLLIIILIVIVPFLLVGATLVREATETYQRIQSGQLDLAAIFGTIAAAMPEWATELLAHFGVNNLADVQSRLLEVLTASSQYLASQAVSVGMGTVGFLVNLAVMLYLLYFLFRDGDTLVWHISAATPLHARRRRALLEKFKVVVRATVKGGILVALAQGALGGLIFWLLGIATPLLWAALMAVLSLVPAVGAGLVWLPVAIYLVATGSVWQGIVLVAYGTMVIGLADNVLRPMLVGKDTKMPDYVVLLSTLGGLEVFGLNGFVIGPVVAAMFISAWQIFAEQQQASAAEADPP